MKIGLLELLLVMFLASLAFAFAATVCTAEAPTPMPTTPANVKCPEDADLIVRYGVNPAGIVAWCMASDDVEAILP